MRSVRRVGSVEVGLVPWYAVTCRHARGRSADGRGGTMLSCSDGRAETRAVGVRMRREGIGGVEQRGMILVLVKAVHQVSGKSA